MFVFESEERFPTTVNPNDQVEICFVPVELLHKSHNAPVPYPTMHHIVTEMCAHAHIYVTKWCIVGYFYDTLWDLWDGSICKGKV